MNSSEDLLSPFFRFVGWMSSLSFNLAVPAFSYSSSSLLLTAIPFAIPSNFRILSPPRYDNRSCQTGIGSGFADDAIRAYAGEFLSLRRNILPSQIVSAIILPSLRI
jgi:hypothetical protein